MRRETIDLITKEQDGAFVLILVEQGPWTGTSESHLRRIQERLTNYLDIAIDGHLAKLHPESRGKPVRIRVDAYDTPPGQVTKLVQRFASYVSESKEVARAITGGQFVAGLAFESSEQALS